MTLRTRTLLLLIPLLLTASLALASPPAPETPQAPAATAQPLAALPAAAPVCKGTDVLLFSSDPQTTATDLCGGCSDAACAGKAPHAVCGSGLRCIPGGPSCTAAEFRCRCLII